MVMQFRNDRRSKEREALREKLWPGSSEKVWKGVGEKGYFPASRNLPLLMQLMREKSIGGTADLSSVYLEFLSRDMGEALVEVLDEQEHAYCAGYTTPRSVRSWRERAKALAEEGFIKIFPKPSREIGYVVIVHPHSVVCELRRKKKLPQGWWEMYVERQRKMGGPVDEDAAA